MELWGAEAGKNSGGHDCGAAKGMENPRRKELVTSQQGEGLRGGATQGWGKGQGQVKDGKEPARRPRPRSGQEGPNPADARLRAERAKRDRG